MLKFPSNYSRCYIRLGQRYKRNCVAELMAQYIKATASSPMIKKLFPPIIKGERLQFC